MFAFHLWLNWDQKFRWLWYTYTVKLCSTKLCSHSIHFSFMLVLHIPSNESKRMVCDIDVKFDVCILYSFSLVYFYSVVRLRAQMEKQTKGLNYSKPCQKIYLKSNQIKNLYFLSGGLYKRSNTSHLGFWSDSNTTYNNIKNNM